MRLIVNGDCAGVSAANLAEALKALDYADAIVATALNGEFVPARKREATPVKDGDRIEIVAPRQGRVNMKRSDGSRLYSLRRQLLPPPARHVAISFAGDPRRGGARERRRDRHRFAAARGGAVEGGAGFLAAHSRTRRARAAQYGGLPQRQGGGDDRGNGARDFGTPWIKLEVIGEADTLQPDVFGLVEAARILAGDGFEVFPYMTEDLVVAEKLVEAGCQVLMPWGAPIGSGKGLNNVFGLRALRAHFPDVPLIVDAGLGLPSHAAAAMELGYDAVLLNTAVAKAGDPVAMAKAFAQGVEAGRAAYLAGPMAPRDMAAPSTPVLGRANCHERSIRFYPIVDSAAWVARLVGVGARLIQLRVKDRGEAEVAARGARGAVDLRAGGRAIDRQRLLARRHRHRRRLHPSGPGGSRRRGYEGDPRQGNPRRDQHSRRGRARARRLRSPPIMSRSARSIRRS